MFDGERGKDWSAFSDVTAKKKNLYINGLFLKSFFHTNIYLFVNFRVFNVFLIIL